MNKANMEQLAQWLEAGAPHVEFDMSEGGSARGFGIACCIAGAAALMSIADEGEVFPTPDQQDYYLTSHGGYTRPWDDVRATALDWLGLEQTTVSRHYGHPLFETTLAPPNCTPKQAAAAVRRVMEGEHPWRVMPSEPMPEGIN